MAGAAGWLKLPPALRTQLYHSREVCIHNPSFPISSFMRRCGQRILISQPRCEASRSYATIDIAKTGQRSDARNEILSQLPDNALQGNSNGETHIETRGSLVGEELEDDGYGIREHVNSVEHAVAIDRVANRNQDVAKGVSKAHYQIPVQCGGQPALLSEDAFLNLDAPPMLFSPTECYQGVLTICQRAGWDLDAKTSFNEVVKNGVSQHSCTVHVQVQNRRSPEPDYHDTVVATARSKHDAKVMAWQHIVFRMHQNADLLRHLPLFETGNENDGDRQVRDLEHLLNSEDMPSHQQYSHAPKELFDARRTQELIQMACAKVKLSLEADHEYSEVRVRKPGQSPLIYHRCTLTLVISDTFRDTSTGEGITKRNAKLAAWIDILMKMHKAGFITRLWPDPSTQAETADEVDAVDAQMSEKLADEEPVEMDPAVLKEEKNAKMEIYDYAAGLGAIPEITYRAVKVSPPRRRLVHRAVTVEATSAVEVTITLPEQSLQATAIARNVTIAETAAALRFKALAEDARRAAQGGTSGSSSAAALSPLNTDTAMLFFDYLRQERPQTQIEVESERVNDIPGNPNTARVVVNNQGPTTAVVMDTGARARLVAHLVAAVRLCQQEPHLLHGFEERLRREKGKIMSQVNNVPLAIDLESTYVMRKALLQARQAGLPDTLQALPAEQNHVQEPIHQWRQSISPSAIAALNAELSAWQSVGEAELGKGAVCLRLQQPSFPMNEHRQAVIEITSHNPYSIIVGATGSGKTTQVPQILLKHEIASARGGSCNIICTQPRRIAAMSVAQRVAQEYQGPPSRRSVGYHVRFDASLPDRGGSITYCTTGILLAQLTHFPESVLDTTSHIIVDEVHERDMYIDMLLILLKKLLKSRATAGKAVSKVILMSATLNSELFAEYFAVTGDDGTRQPCPVLNVPGRMFPVQHKYIDEIMNDIRCSMPDALETLLGKDDGMSKEYLESERAFSAQVPDVTPADETLDVIDWKRKNYVPLGREDSVQSITAKEETLIPTALIAATIMHICKTTTDGAILAFIPGAHEIRETHRHLLSSNLPDLHFRDGSRFSIHLLHSMIPKEDQIAVFKAVPKGCRKIILSTNIAETSITVADVKYVVDCGKKRERRHDPLRRISGLQSVWISKSNAKQRAGRAGRVQNGYYYALYSEKRAESLEAVDVPELLRTDLQEPVLFMKSQAFDEPIEEFLAQAIEPPPVTAVRAARESLQAMQALTENEQLTDLGRLLTKLPVHPILGKMIVLGVLFRCLEPMLALAALPTGQTPLFYYHGGERAARLQAFAGRRFFSGNHASDHLALLGAFRALRKMQIQHGIDAARIYAREHNINFHSFRTMDRTVDQLLEILGHLGLISSPPHLVSTDFDIGPASLNRNAGNKPLIQALLLAGLYPNLAAKVSRNTYRTPTEDGVIIHSSSMNYEVRRDCKKHPRLSLFAFGELTHGLDGKSLFMRDTTAVSPLVAVLFGGRLELSAGENVALKMDDWLPFGIQRLEEGEDAKLFTAKLVLEFRKALDRMLNVAFRDLAALNGPGKVEGAAGGFADEPVRDGFAQMVVELLNHANGQSWLNAFGEEAAEAKL